MIPGSNRNQESLEPENRLSHQVIGAAIEVHQQLGPGLLESAYQASLAREFQLRGISFQEQVPLPVLYKDIYLDCGYRLDFVVGELLVIELKVIEKIQDIHEAQCLTYLKFSGKRLCLLINFRTMLLKDGIRRFVM